MILGVADDGDTAAIRGNGFAFGHRFGRVVSPLAMDVGFQKSQERRDGRFGEHDHVVDTADRRDDLGAIGCRKNGAPSPFASGHLVVVDGDDQAVRLGGSRGMALFERDRETVHIPISGSDQIADVTGAGDTVIATMTLALAAGGTFEEAARLANYAGGLVVMKRGTATITADELRDAVLADAS